MATVAIGLYQFLRFLYCDLGIKLYTHQLFEPKEFPDMRQNERRIKFIRVGGPVRTVGWLKGELNVFTGLQLFFTTSKQKIPTGRVALGDWLGC